MVTGGVVGIIGHKAELHNIAVLELIMVMVQASVFFFLQLMVRVTGGQGCKLKARPSPDWLYISPKQFKRKKKT